MLHHSHYAKGSACCNTGLAGVYRDVVVFRPAIIRASSAAAGRWTALVGLLFWFDLQCLAAPLAAQDKVVVTITQEAASQPKPSARDSTAISAKAETSGVGDGRLRTRLWAWIQTYLWGWIVALIPAALIAHHWLYMRRVRAASLPEKNKKAPSYRYDRPPAVGQERAQALLESAYRRAASERDRYFSPRTLNLGYGIAAFLNGVVAITVFMMLSAPPVWLNPLPTATQEGLIYGGVGAYVYVLLYLGRRNFRHDITTGAATWCTVHLAIGPVLGAAVAHIWQVLGTGAVDVVPDKQSQATVTTAAACFLAGLAPRQVAAAAQALARRLWSGGSTTVAPRTTALTQVRGVTPEVEDRLVEEGVDDVFSLAMASPLRLVRNTPFDRRQLLAWIDEAILIETLPKSWQALEAEGITGAIDLAYYADDNSEDAEPSASVSAALHALASRTKVDPGTLRDNCNRLFEDAQVQLIWAMYQDCSDGASSDETGDTSTLAGKKEKLIQRFARWLPSDWYTSTLFGKKEKRMVDHSTMRLGKHPARRDDRTLQMASYLRVEELPKIPTEYSWAGKVSKWPMMKNDTVGDCTCAAAGHLIEEWTADVGATFVPTDDQIIAAYSAITGYDPKTGANDNGANELDVLNYWRKTGIADRKIQAYVALEPRNRNHVLAAVYLFGGCYIGVQLPLSAQKQRVWAVPPEGPTGRGAPNSWGGHAVPVVAYDDHGLTVVTWGALKRMTWSFWETYCDEAYAILSPDFLKAEKSPLGFDVVALEEDLKQVAG